MIKYNNKSGSAILLALMIMSVILSSVLYINVLSIRAMNQSRNIDNSLVAFYAAETGNEQAVYYIRKVEDVDIGELNLPTGSISAGKNLVTRVVTNSVANILIGLKKDETYQLDVFDQDDLSRGSSVAYLRLSWDDDCSADSKVELTVNEWEADSTINWGQMQDQMHINKCLLDYSTSEINIDDSGTTCSDILLNEQMSYQFRFKALNCDIHNFNIRAFDQNDQQVSFKNIYSVESVGEYPINNSQSNRQALRVNLRKFSPLSGLFDYVLFSEKSLVKDIDAYTSGWFGDKIFISTESLPDGRRGSNYSYAVNVINGSPPYSWTLGGHIPTGLEIDGENGILNGVIEEDGIFLLMITVAERSNPSNTDSKNLFLQVNQ